MGVGSKDISPKKRNKFSSNALIKQIGAFLLLYKFAKLFDD